MKKQFTHGDGFITVETAANGKMKVTVTDADGTTAKLDEFTAAGTLTQEQEVAISHRFGDANKDGQPF